MKLSLKTAALIVACLGFAGCWDQGQPAPKPAPPPKATTVTPAPPVSPPVEEEKPVKKETTPEASVEPEAPAKPETPEEKPQNTEQHKAMVKTESFGKTKEGEEVTLFTCTNKNGLVLKMMDYGATVVSVETPDKDGKQENITLSFPTLDGYLQRHPYFGSTVGRYGNRIANGKFKIGDEEYTLATNNSPNHLHGGVKGFDAVMWKGS